MSANKRVFGTFEGSVGGDRDSDGNRDRDRDRDRNRDREEREVVLNAATGGAGPLPITTTPLTNTIPVVSVTIDTDDLRENFNVLLNFTSIISLPQGSRVTLIFEVLRMIDNGRPVRIGPTFTFTDMGEIAESESFGFQVFDPNLEARRITYTVVLATNTRIEGVAGVTITNAVLSALAVENECR